MTMVVEKDSPSFSGDCDRRARVNFAASVRALQEACPWVGAVAFPDGEVVAARDGSLSLRPNGGWLGDCSVPRVTARRMLAAVQLSGPVACLLEPPHAQTILETLSRLGLDRAVIAVVAEEALPGICACADLSEALAAHRLFVLTAPRQLSQLYDIHPGLSLPSYFIRLSFLDDVRASRLIAEVQAAILPVMERQKADGARLREAAGPTVGGNVCVLGGRRFRLWGDGGQLLLDAGGSGILLDTDDPVTATTHAILRAAQGCRAVVSADIWRHVLRDLLPAEMPWHVWLTTAADVTDVPLFSFAGPHDQIWVCQESWRRAALAAGWPAGRTHVVTPPQMAVEWDPNGPLALVGDTLPLTTPADIEEYSSLRLLWEAIRDELLHHPQRVGDSAQAYLESRRAKLGLRADQLDSRRFIGHLVVAAHQQGVARQLCALGVPVAVWGQGWELPDVVQRTQLPAGVVRGIIADRADLARALAGVRALVDWRVSGGPVLMESSGIPLVRPGELLHGQRPRPTTAAVGVGLVQALKQVGSADV